MWRSRPPDSSALQRRAGEGPLSHCGEASTLRLNAVARAHSPLSTGACTASRRTPVNLATRAASLIRLSSRPIHRSMPRPPLSADEISAFRGRIAEVASKLFAQHGYESVTMRAVADALGVSAMALYRYVADKAELLTLVRTLAYRAFADDQARAFARASDPKRRMDELGKAYVAFALQHADWYRIMLELDQPQGENAELEHEVQRSFSYLLEAIKGELAAGLVQGDALTLAHLAWANVHGMVSLHLAGKLNLGRSIHDLTAHMRQPSEALEPRRKPASEKPSAVKRVRAVRKKATR
jgi:AcrR family transcriptional regulator